MTTGVEIVSDLVDKWNAHDLDAAYALLAEDYREYINGTLVKIGRAEARAADEPMYETTPDYSRTVEELWGVDDRVLGRYVMRGTMPNGSKLEVPFAGIYGIRDGHIFEAHFYLDTTALTTE